MQKTVPKRERFCFLKQPYKHPVWHHADQKEDDRKHHLGTEELDKILHGKHPKGEVDEINRIFVWEQDLVKTKVKRIKQGVWFDAQGKSNVRQRYPEGRHCSKWGKAEVCQNCHQPSGPGNANSPHVLHIWNDDVGDGFADSGGRSHKTDGHAANDKENELKVDTIDVFLLDHAKAWECQERWEQYEDISELLLVDIGGNDVQEDDDDSYSRNLFFTAHWAKVRTFLTEEFFAIDWNIRLEHLTDNNNHQETKWNKDGIVGQELHKVHADVRIHRGGHGYQETKIGWYINEEPRHKIAHCPSQGNPSSGFGLLETQCLANTKGKGRHGNARATRQEQVKHQPKEEHSPKNPFVGAICF